MAGVYFSSREIKHFFDFANRVELENCSLLGKKNQLILRIPAINQRIINGYLLPYTYLQSAGM